jgi:hypothetical protein
MRVLALLALVGLAVVGQAHPGAAQSPYDYPWCSLRADLSGAQSCYYASYGQCMIALGGIGGSCVQNPGYRGAARVERHPRRY